MKLYRPKDIRKMTEKEVRAEYSKLRATANKRISRMKAKTGKTMYHDTFEKLKNLSDPAAALADVSNFLRNERTTIRGYEEFINTQVEYFTDKGWDFITQENVVDFFKFMDEKRNEVGAKIFDSSAAADAYNQAQRLRIPTEILSKNFNYFLEHQNEMEEIAPQRNGREMSMREVKRRINRLP